MSSIQVGDICKLGWVAGLVTQFVPASSLYYLFVHS